MDEKEIVKVSATEYNIVIPPPVVEATIIRRSLAMVDQDISAKKDEIANVETFLETKKDELNDLEAERAEAVSKGVEEAPPETPEEGE